MTTESPFMLSRFEYEPKHLYYLPDSVFGRLELPKPTHLIGTRGTGKTTLLQALEWHERLTNDTLKRQVGNKPFSKHYIGIYLKLPDTQCGTIAAWLSGTDPDQAAIVLAIYFDLLWLELLPDAIAELTFNGIFQATAELEQEWVRKCVQFLQNEYGTSANSLLRKPIRTLKDLSASLRQGRRSLEECAFARMSPIEALAGFPVETLGGLGRKLGKFLSQYCDEMSASSGDPWHFKICMDEAEGLGDFALRAINSVVRFTTTPVFPILSFVTLPQLLTGTLSAGLTLSDADRQMIVLDEMKKVDFMSLSEGVMNVRVQAKLKQTNATVDLKRTLGSLNINGLLRTILEQSVNPKAKEWLKLAEARQISKIQVPSKKKKNAHTKNITAPPIYQEYLHIKLGLQLPKGDESWQRRNEESAKFRKRMVAAYLSICRELKADVRYASADMLLGMSDGCVRDFLSFMHEIFIEADVSLRKFLDQEVPAEKQNVAIKRASLQKRATIAERGVPYPTETGRLIDSLAQITRIIQSESSDNSHLRASERGIFAINYANNTEERSTSLWRLIKDAGETGFLRVLEAGPSLWRFRVHKSLAAAYGFSYRGAYYQCRLNAQELNDLLAVEDANEYSSAVHALGTRLTSSDPATKNDDINDRGGTLFGDAK